jgi:hypothetical protein
LVQLEQPCKVLQARAMQMLEAVAVAVRVGQEHLLQHSVVVASAVQG